MTMPPTPPLMMCLPDEHISEGREVTMLYIVHFSNAPWIAPPTHLLIVGIDYSIAPYHSKGNGLLERERKADIMRGGGHDVI